MNSLPFIFLIILFQSSCKVIEGEKELGRNKTYQISGTVTYTSNYCGGARPSETLLQQLAIPTPYPGKQIHFRKGNSNDLSSLIIKTIVTDSLGKFTLQLEPGKYCIIDDYRKDRSFVDSMLHQADDSYLKVQDPQCINDWLSTCLYSLTVKDQNLMDIQINIHRECFRPEGVPCINYTGPLPP
jgi:hypothetical protein